MQSTTSSNGRDFVVIVSGLPRSGTSLTMQMLRAGGIPVLTDEIRKADEDNRRGYFEFEPVKRTKTDPSWLRQAHGKAVKMVYLLLYDLPATYQYRVLFLRRNLAEVLASQRAMLQRQGKNAGNIEDADMKRLVESDLERINAWLSRQSNCNVLYVDYNQLIRDPKSHVGTIDAFVGGQLDTEAMAAAVDISQYRNRQEWRQPSAEADGSGNHGS